ncbi:MAG: hypothetical protein IJM39_01835 [Firmicutes bacterium]|nr:hypothetical protein [Bacillota bacterium]
MRSFFKPLSKRDATVIAVIFGLALIALIVNFVKSLIGGSTFDDVRSDIILIVFAAIVEWAMINIALSKDKKDEEKPENGEENKAE